MGDYQQVFSSTYANEEKVMSKGGTFERDICKELSMWWTDNSRDDIFWRTSGSGARATARRKSGVTTQNSSGDVGYLAVNGMPLIDLMCIEIKRGYTSSGRITKKLSKEIENVVLDYSVDKIGMKDALKKINKVFAKTKKRGQLDPLDIVDSTTNKQTTLEEFWLQCETDRTASKRIFSWLIFKRDMKQTSIMVAESFMCTAEQFCGGYPDRVLSISLEYVPYNLYIVNFSKFLDWCDADTIKLIWEDYYEYDEVAKESKRRKTKK